MPAKKVKFYAKRPSMEISIDGKIYKFESGVLSVDAKLAEQIQRHHLISQRPHLHGKRCSNCRWSRGFDER